MIIRIDIIGTDADLETSGQFPDRPKPVSRPLQLFSQSLITFFCPFKERRDALKSVGGGRVSASHRRRIMTNNKARLQPALMRLRGASDRTGRDNNIGLSIVIVFLSRIIMALLSDKWAKLVKGKI